MDIGLVIKGIGLDILMYVKAKIEVEDKYLQINPSAIPCPFLTSRLVLQQ